MCGGCRVHVQYICHSPSRFIQYLFPLRGACHGFKAAAGQWPHRVLRRTLQPQCKPHPPTSTAVRGAYMVLERQRAREMGYPSPIHETKDDTHANYNA